MATEAEKSAVDQGHTAESAIAPPPAPVAAVAIAAAPLLPLAPPTVVATSAVPLPLSPAPPPNLPHAGFVSGAPVPVAQPSHVAQPPAQAVAGGPALGTAVGAGPDSAHLVAPSAAPVKPVAQRLTESQIHLAAGGSAAAHRGRGSPRRRPSSSYRSAHRGGRGGWWGGHGHGRSGPSEMQQLREDFPGMLVAAMRNALNGAPNLVTVLRLPTFVLCPPCSIRPCPGFPLFRTRDLWEREAEGRGEPSFLRVVLLKLRPCSRRPLFPFRVPR
ncbi:unnamed protein product [Closterium sp. NIES-65]|nr:unnamed protein product [Closterium sp. NIES-65]